MILKQYYLGCLAHASYLIGDEETQTAAIVDPQREIDQYLSDAETLGLRIRHVFLTHFHADFVAGHLEVRNRVGAVVHLGSRARAEFFFEPMQDAQTLSFGRIRLKFLETPGHTPESVCLLVYDLAVDPQTPYAALTGDTLFIGDVGRPDLGALIGWSAETLANLLYDSLRKLSDALSDDTLIYPAHGAGSLCGKNLSKDTVSTMGAQRQHNYALQPMDRAAFIAMVTADQPESPTYFSYDADFNAREHETLDHVLHDLLKPLSLSEALVHAASGAKMLDTRDGTDFEGAPLAGSINIGLGGQYASWAGSLLDRKRPIVLIAEPGAEEESAMRLGRIGFDHIAGYLEGGMQTLSAHPELVHRPERITAATLDEYLALPDPPLILDVRSAKERQQKKIEGSLHVPLNHLEERLTEIPRDRAIVVHCAGGYRSAVAASLLRRHGFERVMDLVGGLAAWEAARQAVVVA
ncbi:MAG: MBL fold metallo-hydrolase [candidate division Zixibacteria bacterium]|nr:MBL fold metallo-hydrolase [candidate division Zixibacteria bacterium]